MDGYPLQEQQLLKSLDELESRAKTDYFSQSQSPLFRIPAEIRNAIFAIVVTEYEDSSNAYDLEAYYYRPGFQAPLLVDVALLRSCKRIWLETRPLPAIALASSSMGFVIAMPDRRPPEYDTGLLQMPRTRKLLSHQWGHLHTMRICLQGLVGTNINNFFDDRPFHVDLRVSTVIFTTRYTDWLWWENSHPLSLDGFEMSITRLPESVQRVVMEFEIIESRENELDTMLRDVFHSQDEYKWTCLPERELSIEHHEDPWPHIKRTCWAGPTRIGGEEFEHHPPGNSMNYVVKSVSWG